MKGLLSMKWLVSPMRNVVILFSLVSLAACSSVSRDASFDEAVPSDVAWIHGIEWERGFVKVGRVDGVTAGSWGSVEQPVVIQPGNHSLSLFVNIFEASSVSGWISDIGVKVQAGVRYRVALSPVATLFGESGFEVWIQDAETLASVSEEILIWPVTAGK